MELLFIFSLFFFHRHSIRWGDWDAVAIWNLHAKFLFFSNDFAKLFTNNIGWSHPDYPLMLSSYSALFWKGLGYISPLVPSIFAYIIGIAIPVSLYAALKNNNLKFLGVIAFLIFCFNLKLVRIASTQYSDTLLALFLLLTIILKNHLNYQKYDNKVLLIGFFSASCGWIKNEGLLFFLIFTFYFLLENFRNLRFIKSYLLGAVFPLIIIFIFKFFYAPANDIFSGQSSDSFTKILDFFRYITILKFVIKTFFLNFTLLLSFLILIFFINKKYYLSFNFRIIFTMFLCYFCIYLITPYNLNWHLTYSCNRLIYQLYPVIIYSFMLLIEQKFSNNSFMTGINKIFNKNITNPY